MDEKDLNSKLKKVDWNLVPKTEKTEEQPDKVSIEYSYKRELIVITRTGRCGFIEMTLKPEDWERIKNTKLKNYKENEQKK